MDNCQLSGICLVKRSKTAYRVRLRLLLKQGASCLGSNLNLTQGAGFWVCTSKNSCRIKSVFLAGMSGFPEAKIKDYPQTLQILSIFLTTLFYKETISNFAFKLVRSYEMHQGKRG